MATGGVLFGVPGVGKLLTAMLTSSKTNIITVEVKPANLPVIVTERGSLESSQSEDVFCQVEGQTTIISIVPEGTRVAQGQLVCELDSSALKDQLTNQEIATRGAEASYQNAKLTREVAEIAVTEYEEGIFKQDWETVEGEVKLAESDLKRAEDRVDWSKRMLEKRYVSKAQYIADELALQRAKFALEQAQTKRKVLKDFTKDKTVKELRSEVEKARSDELAKQATWELEKSKEAKLRKQIENCKLYAPAPGLVVYANDPNRFGGNNQPQIEEGATVRERQKIFSLPDISKMRVNTKVHESMIDRLAKGLRARIRVESFADESLPGVVEDVAPLPDPTSFFSSDVKLYTTHVTIEKGLPGLRPGMTAQVEILVTELENVLSVPVQAVLQFKGKDHVAVKKENGFEWREVALGLANDKLIELKKGITPGMVVALNPIALMSEQEKRENFDSGKGATKKNWGGPSSVARTVLAAPGAGGPPGAPGTGTPDGKAKAKVNGQRGGFAGTMDAAAKQKLMSAGPDARRKMLEANGVPPDRIDMILQRMKEGAGGGGGFGGPSGGGVGFGGPGVGFGGPGVGHGGSQ